MSSATESAVRSATASRRHTWVAAGVAALALFAAGAQAQGVEVSKLVRYEDLNLRTQADVQRLYSRLQHAARDVCGETNSRDLRMLRLAQRCYEVALRDAVEDVGHASVIALHASEAKVRVAQRRAPADSAT